MSCIEGKGIWKIFAVLRAIYFSIIKSLFYNSYSLTYSSTFIWESIYMIYMQIHFCLGIYVVMAKYCYCFVPCFIAYLPFKVNLSVHIEIFSYLEDNSWNKMFNILQFMTNFTHWPRIYIPFDLYNRCNSI